MQAELIALENAMHKSRIPYKRAIRLFKRQMIIAAIDRNDCTKAAAMDLGVTPTTINNHMRQRADDILAGRESL